MTLVSMESLVRDHSYAAPSPPGAGTPRPGPGVTWIHSFGRTWLNTQTANGTSLAAAANTNPEGARECQRVREILSAPGSGGGGPLLAMTGIDLTFWRGGVYGKLDSDSALRGSTQRDFLKKG